MDKSRDGGSDFNYSVRLQTLIGDGVAVSIGMYAAKQTKLCHNANNTRRWSETVID